MQEGSSQTTAFTRFYPLSEAGFDLQLFAKVWAGLAEGELDAYPYRTVYEETVSSEFLH